MKIITLIEDGQCENAPQKLLSEHGLSFYIEYQGKRFLLDGGQSEAFSRNAASLGVDLSQVDIAVLSHGHYDHSGGVDWFLRNNKKAQLYLSECCRENCYGGADYHYIGLRPGFLEEWKERLAYVMGKRQISEGVWLLSHDSKSKKKREKIGEQCRLYRKEAVPEKDGRKAAYLSGGFCGDDFNHEISLVFQERNGLVVFNSCSHSGVAEIFREVEAAFAYQPILAFFGGMHLSKKTQEEVRVYAGVLKDYMEKADWAQADRKENGKEENVKEENSRKREKSRLPKLYTGHCTGEAACGILEEELGVKLERLFSGRQILLEQ